VIPSDLDPVDEHDGNQVAVAPTELLVEVDIDLHDLRTRLGRDGDDGGARHVAEVAPGAAEQPYAGGAPGRVGPAGRRRQGRSFRGSD
jgi:hypothetical protein